MPKKRNHLHLYTKPQSSLHRPSSTIGNGNDASPPSVTELLHSLRMSQLPPADRHQVAPAASLVLTPSMPPPIRQLLQWPEVPAPRPRDGAGATATRSRVDADALRRRVPPGPATPRSWRMWSEGRGEREGIGNKARVRSGGLELLPGVVGEFPEQNSLRDICFRKMAREWEGQREYNRYHLARLPTQVRVMLLSYIANYGPEDGVGLEGLKALLWIPDNVDEVWGEADEEGSASNDDFHRLDLSGSIGRSVSLNNLEALIMPPPTAFNIAAKKLYLNTAATAVESWDTPPPTLPHSLATPPLLTSLKYLSLAHVPNYSHQSSWNRLLSLAKHLPTLTHLSLAHWPVPSLSPNSVTATVSAPHAPRGIPYGGSGMYSHSLDDDWREAASILRRLSRSLYGLEWLDVDGCVGWARALHWGNGANGAVEDGGVDWRDCWGGIRVVQLRSVSGGVVETGRTAREETRRREGLYEALLLEDRIRGQRGWISVLMDEWGDTSSGADMELRIVMQKRKLWKWEWGEEVVEEDNWRPENIIWNGLIWEPRVPNMWDHHQYDY